MDIKYTSSCRTRSLGFTKLTLLFLLLFISGCNLFNDDNGDGAVLWNTLSSYEKLGTLSAEQIQQVYPGEVGALLVFDVALYRLIYNTETPGGEPVQASGVVLIPQRNNPAAMLSLHRTTIFHNSEAPSNVNINSSAGLNDVNAVWTNLGPVSASGGFITVMPDLLGWGSSGNLLPPYLVSFSEGIVSLDMLKAAVEFLDSEEIEWNRDLFVTGYSQGGSTTMSAIRSIQADPHQQFEITAASAGGGAYNLEDLAATILEKEELAFSPYYVFFVKAYRDTYFPTRPLSTFFNSPYDLRIESEQLFRGGYFGYQIEERLTSQTNLLVLNTFRNQYITGGETDFRNALAENNLSRFHVQSPLRIYHGDQDEIIPYSEVEKSVEDLVRSGSEDVQLVRVEGGTHRSSADTFFQETFFWFLGQ